MHKVMATVPYTFMDTRQNLVGFAAALWFAFFVLGLLSASLCQCFFITAKEARVVYELAVGQGQKGVQASVKPDAFTGRQQEVIFLLYGEADKPLGAISANCASLDRADNWPMQFGLNLRLFALQREPDTVFANLKPTSG